jgi:adenosylcobinamide-phosphate synthase
MIQTRLFIVFFALLADRYFGEPEWLWSRMPHPVALFGKGVSMAEDALLDENADPRRKRTAGIWAIILLLLAALIAGSIIAGLFSIFPVVGLVLEIGLVSIFIAQRSLADHVGAVAQGFRENGLAGGREAVSMIVGRDPEKLDEAGVCRAAVESLAENTSDGVVAPLFWYLAMGLPGILAYKMLNTADSMVGHRNERYVDFGRASARADDWANWIPARITGLLTAIAVFPARGANAAKTVFETMMRDARLHRSPNAGWPESAFAAALGLALGGPRVYHGDVASEPFLNGAGRVNANPYDIDWAIKLFWQVCWALTAVVLVLGVLV